MIYDTLTIYEQEMILFGYDKMSVDYQNKLATHVAKKLGLSWMSLRPEHVLQYHKDLKTSMMNEFYEIDIAKGFTATNGHTYRTNTDDQINFLGKMLLLYLKPDITEVNWKPEDLGEYLVHTRDEWLQVASEGFAHKEQQLMKYNEKATAIKTATTHEEVVKVSWGGQYPHK